MYEVGEETVSVSVCASLSNEIEREVVINLSNLTLQLDGFSLGNYSALSMELWYTLAYFSLQPQQKIFN